MRARVGVTESQKEPERDSLTFLAYLNIVLLQNNQIRLSCRDTSKYGIFCQKLSKYAPRAEKMAASALRADSTLSPTLKLITAL